MTPQTAPQTTATEPPPAGVDDLTLADFQLIDALARGEDAGHVGPKWTALAETLGRDPSNLRRTAKKLAARKLFTLAPVHVPAGTRAFAARMLGAQDAALPAPAAPASGAPGIRLLSVADLRESDFNPRKTFTEESIAELAESILAQGLIQNLMARPHPAEPGAFELAAGTRRFRAMSLLAEQGRSSPAFDPAAIEVRVKDLSDADMILIGLTENADREQPHPLEEADAFLRLRDLRAAEAAEQGLGAREAGKVTAEIAEALGKSRKHVQDRIRMAEKLAPEAQDAFRKGEITTRQARELARIPADRQVELIQQGDLEYLDEDDNIVAAGLDDAVLREDIAFHPSKYDGPVWTDEETGDVYFLDASKVAALTRDHAETLKAVLLDEGVAWVKIVEGWFSPYNFPNAREDSPRETVGTVILIRDQGRKLETHENKIIREETVQEAAKDAAIAQREELYTAALAAGLDVQPEPYQRRHWVSGKQAKTLALRRSVPNAPPRMAMVLAMLGMIEHASLEGGELIGIHPHRWHGDNRDVDQAVRGGYRSLATALEEAPCPGLAVKDGCVTCEDAAAAFDALMDRDDAPDLFTAAVTDRVIAHSRYGSAAPGEDALTIAVARRLGLDNAVPAANPTRAYFEAFNQGSLAMIALAMGYRPETIPASMSKADMVDTLHESNAKRIDAEAPDTPPFAPPEWAFAPAEETEAACAALLRGGQPRPDTDAPREETGA